MKHKGRQQERKEGHKIYKTGKKINKMAVVSPSLPVITLNVNELNSPVKRHREAE